MDLLLIRKILSISKEIDLVYAHVNGRIELIKKDLWEWWAKEKSQYLCEDCFSVRLLLTALTQLWKTHAQLQEAKETRDEGHLLFSAFQPLLTSPFSAIMFEASEVLCFPFQFLNRNELHRQLVPDSEASDVLSPGDTMLLNILWIEF